ncbi:MAG: Inner membrane ABC transporter permease protein YejE [Alphaproteobacteria bacterium MarineAlpha2_Bin1]|nr:MAG: Inner membrane ABC transporter permease protein YejE [Alphaproteobacteria bacterium MarineAlpha2_Bin1]
MKNPHLFSLSNINSRRLNNFKKNRRGFYSFIILIFLFITSIFANFIANERPIIIFFENKIYLPILIDYPETVFDGEFETNTDYRDPFVKELIQKKGWMIWPLIPFSHDTINYELKSPAPSPPDGINWLGTDDQGRDVFARLIYGFRISLLFGLILTSLSSIIGVGAGAIQGYFGGIIDLTFQRFIEVWESIPLLYLLIILAAIITPGFWSLLFILLLFSWMSLVGVVRAEFLKTRNFEYVRAATALGVKNNTIIFRHILPNAMVATITFLPFILAGSITSLTALDFLGFGLPPGSPSLGEMLQQGKSNLQAPWLGITSFFSIAIILTLVVFIGEAVRDAFDPRKIFN